jgi:hypothetical protein
MMKRRSILLILTASAVALFANPPVDYSVYFDPQPASPNGAPVTPIRTIANGKLYERVYGIMYDVGETLGTHTYKYTLRVPRNGTALCEVSTLVKPFGPKNASHRIAYFEAVYPAQRLGLAFPKLPPGKRYNMFVTAFEQVPAGQASQDASPGNNAYPNSSCCEEVVEVRANVESTHCGIVPQIGVH